MTKIAEKTFSFEVSGPNAQFLAPEGLANGENQQYLVPTYSAIRSICEAIYWKPTVVWVPQKIRVMSQIIQTPDGVLKNVVYRIQAHMEWNEKRPDLEGDRNDAKHIACALRALQRGGRMECFLGHKAPEFKAIVRPCEFREGDSAYDLIPEVSFGEMLHSVDYPVKGNNTKTIHYFNCSMKKGVIAFPRPEDCPYHAEAPYWAS